MKHYIVLIAFLSFSGSALSQYYLGLNTRDLVYKLSKERAFSKITVDSKNNIIKWREEGGKLWYFATFNDEGITYKVIWLPDDVKTLYEFKKLFDSRFTKRAKFEWTSVEDKHCYSIRFDVTSFDQNLIIFTQLY